MPKFLQPIQSEFGTSIWRTRSLSYLICAGAVILTVSMAEAQPDDNGTALENAMMEGHNAARQIVGVRPLVWDPDLAASAAECAAQLARTEQFQHCQMLSGQVPQGENLWMGTISAYSFPDMIKSWTDERANKFGNYGMTGHYDQVVWGGTTTVGCAIASSQAYDYLVCRYWPQGNIF